MKRTKVALDANIPQRLVRMLTAGFGDQGFEFLWEPNFALANAADEDWATAFRRFGGEVILTGDANIAKRPHQIMAIQGLRLTGFFFHHKWSDQDMAFKAGHLMMWWPRIQAQFANSRPGDCFWVPPGLKDVPMKKAELPESVKDARKAAGE